MTDRTGNSISTSFSSKSELALNLSTSGSALTFMGYKALINTLNKHLERTAAHLFSPIELQFGALFDL